jgi:hypothetical protein
LWDDFIDTKSSIGDDFEYLHVQEKWSRLLDFGTRRRLSLFDTTLIPVYFTKRHFIEIKITKKPNSTKVIDTNRNMRL